MRRGVSLDGGSLVDNAESGDLGAEPDLGELSGAGLDFERGG
jgi:hypothetical protein